MVAIYFFIIPVKAQFVPPSGQTSSPLYSISPADLYRAQHLAPSIEDMSDFGDSWNPDTGEVQLRHSDISLPGNSALPVEISRLRTRSRIAKYTQAYVFGDWDIGIPKIEFEYVDRLTNDPSGAHRNLRCSGNAPVSFSLTRDNGTGAYIDSGAVIQNIRMSDLSGGAQLLLRTNQNRTSWAGAFVPTNTTTKFWKISCAGVGGFLAKSPDGVEYRFDVDFVRPTGKLFGVGFLNRGTFVQIFPSQIRDVNGNWLQFTYNQYGPTSIRANDGRQIDIICTRTVIA